MLSSQQAQPTPKASPIGARPYKDFLTPALHRRFTRAAGLILALCWLEAFLMSHGAGYFWSWFPFSTTGLRALLLFMPCLAVFIVRVGNMHAGHLNTTSGFETFVSHSTSLRTLATIVWYVYSAWFFGEAYIWAQGQERNLGWVDLGKSYERPRVNENPIILRWLFVWVALAQAMRHLARDVDRIQVEVKEQAAQQQQGQEKQEKGASRIPKAVLDLSMQKKDILNRILQLTIAGIIATGIPLYYAIIRRFAWPMAYTIGRIFFRQLPASAAPHGIVHPGTFIWQAFTSVGMLVVLWEVSNAVFTSCVSEPPLKREHPLTSEIKDARGTIISRSTDPNGSLLRGCRAKKDVPKTFAFWELYLICVQFPARRKTLFAEADRKDTAGQPHNIWSQVSQLCLAEITAISDRIAKSQEPLGSPGNAANTQLQQTHQRQDTFSLPKISDRRVEDNPNVFQQRSQNSIAHTAGNLVKSVGQSPGAVSPLVPRARKAIEYAADRSLSKDTQDRWRNSDGLGKEAKGYMTQFLQTPLGEPFRQTFARRLQAVVFGVPYSNKANVVHAARSLTKLVVSSLKEDNFGFAAKDVSGIIRTFTATIRNVETFVQVGLTPSWTDVGFDERRDRQLAGSGEVGEVVAVLRSCLREMVLTFGEYADSVGLSAKDVGEARETVGGGGAEMKQVQGT